MKWTLRTDRFADQRMRMVTSHLRARGIDDERVLAAMARVPRHQFVPEAYWSQAYEDHPLPIGEEQTISQPYIVALTLAALAVKPWDVVLEVGTGSGYQTALLAELSRHVYSMERHASLAQTAQATLSQLGYSNVTVVVEDGSQGLPGQAPFDLIAVSAAAGQIPPALFSQLREGGRMVIPVGPPEAQELQFVRKKNGAEIISFLGGCRFVPLIASDETPTRK